MNLPGTVNNNAQCKREGISDQILFLSRYEQFKQLLLDLIERGESKTFYKFSDGEYFWLTNKQVGSVAPGRRDSNVARRDLSPFKEGVVQNDYLLCQALTSHVDWYRAYFKQEPQHYVDYVYALVANKWFTSQFDGQIGLIGAGPKLDVIKELCTKQEYLDYLQFSGFTDYIKMPQKYLCDNLEEGEALLAEQLPNSTSKIFLVGIGHAQQALLHRMKKYKDAIYIVVGSGICAYAGVQDNARPYMGDWINYRLSNYNYTGIDIWKDNFTNIKTI
jgi:hypothetical protein